MRARPPSLPDSAQELALVQRVLTQEPAALAALMTLIEQAAVDAAHGLKQSSSFGRELASVLTVRLLVGKEGNPPRVGTFAGRSSLATWLKSAAVRAGLNLLEGQRRDVDSIRDSHPGADLPLEAQLMRRRYAPAFTSALEGALRDLPRDERALLKLVFVEGLSLEEVGKMRAAHKSTISRQVTRIRAALLETVRGNLMQALKLNKSELSSLVRLLDSQLELSLERVFAERSDDER
jgi:RNA polymerase sigma-70 factor (ECF subfamily)